MDLEEAALECQARGVPRLEQSRLEALLSPPVVDGKASPGRPRNLQSEFVQAFSEDGFGCKKPYGAGKID